MIGLPSISAYLNGRKKDEQEEKRREREEINEEGEGGDSSGGRILMVGVEDGRSE